jgi:hypothetical protein
MYAVVLTLMSVNLGRVGIEFEDIIHHTIECMSIHQLQAFIRRVTNELSAWSRAVHRSTVAVTSTIVH